MKAEIFANPEEWRRDRKKSELRKIIRKSTKLGRSNWVQEIVTGGIIIAAVLLDYLRRRSVQR